MSQYPKPEMGSYQGAMSFEEIAQVMGISKQLVWFYYVSAIRKLRRQSGTLRRLHSLAMALDQERERRMA
jgi:DNA-directed RNA polymerase specialized sigma24 family protein